MIILARTPVAQAFWLVQAWRVLDAVAWPELRYVLQGLWVAAALVVLAAGLDLLGVRVIPRQALRPWGRMVARLWLIASCIGVLGVTVVGTIAGLSRPVTAVLPPAQQARVEPARRAAFRYAADLAGGLPLLATASGATAGRRRFRLVTVDVPMANLPPIWMVSASPTSAIATSGTSCPARPSGVPSTWPTRRRPISWW
jgi:hypothetical protein